MLINEFDSQGWGSDMKVRYENEVREVASVHFVEKLIGLIPEDDFDETECLEWVRCENCELIDKRKG